MSTRNHCSLEPQQTRRRLWLIVLMFSLLAAACGGTSDGAGAVGSAAERSVIESTAEDADSPAAPTETVSQLAAAPTEPAEPTAAPIETVSKSVESFDVVIKGAITFSEDGPNTQGMLTVVEGADALGCDGGTSTEDGSAPIIVRLWTCTSGSRSGTITFTFKPFDGPWNVTDATGDFAGLSGAGKWFGQVSEDGSTGADVLTGTMRFGEALMAASNRSSR